MAIKMNIDFGIVGSWGLLHHCMYYFKELFRYDTDNSEPDNEYIYLIIDNDCSNLQRKCADGISVYDRYDGSPLK